MFVKLKSSGNVQLQSGDGLKDEDEVLEKKAMLVYAGKFDSMDGEVEVTDEHIERLVNNHNDKHSRLSKLAQGETPSKGCPPIQLDHSASARDTVGRAVGRLSIGDHISEDGSVVKAVFCDNLRFLGAENTKPVRDGRWQDLSIGADLEEGVFSEITVTPFPAAPGSALLSKGKKMTEEEKKLKKHLMEKEELSAEEAEEKLAGMDDEEKKELSAKMSNAEDAPDSAEDDTKLSKKGKRLSNAEDGPDSAVQMATDDDMKSYLKRTRKLTDDDAEAYLRDMEDAEKKELSKKMQSEQEGGVHVDINSHDGEDEDEGEANLSNAEDAPDSADGDKSTLSADTRSKLTKLAAKIRKSTGQVSLAHRKASIGHQLNKLRMSAKITPAEIKKFDLDKIARMSKESREAVLKSYEDREPVIPVGLVGTTKATNIAEVEQQAYMTQLEAETRQNMTLLSKTAPKNVKSISSDARLAEGLRPVYRADFQSICRLMDEGNIKGAKVALKKFIEDGNVLGKTLNDETQLSTLAEQVKSLQNDVNEVLSELGI